MYLNVDLGEEIKPNLEIEKAVMPYIDACNIACGGHAGNKIIMEECIRLAKKHKVWIGAHPSYPDRLNFGRRTMSISNDTLLESLFYQIYLLQKLAEKQNTKVHHIKLHGALYNDAAKDEALATLIVKAIRAYDSSCILFVPPNSILEEKAKQGDIRVYCEVFGDRNYNDDLSLLSRSNNKALITNKLDLSLHLQSMLHEKKITTVSGKSIPVNINTICMHSDHQNAVRNIKHVSKWIKEARQ